MNVQFFKMLHKCGICEKKYATAKSFAKHFRNIHDSSFTLKGLRTPYKCDDCPAEEAPIFQTKNEIRKHILSNHKNYSIANSIKKVKRSKIVCSVKNCKERFPSYMTYIEHLRSKHTIDVAEETIQFTSLIEFQTWMDTIPKAYYVKECGSSISRHSKLEYFRCNRSYSANITSGKRTKFGGSVKIGSVCPSHFRVKTQNDGNKITVNFVKTHVGHNCENGYIPLSLLEKRKIADKLNAGVSIERTLEDIRSTGDPDSKQLRIHLVDRKDIHNIIKQFKIDHKVLKHNSDSVSVRIIVRELEESAAEKGEMNPVLLFKDQENLDKYKVGLLNEKEEKIQGIGHHDEEEQFYNISDEENAGELEEIGLNDFQSNCSNLDQSQEPKFLPESKFLPQDFVLVIMTSFQGEMLKKLGHHRICIDGTHGLNAYDFNLYTLVTIDEFDNGIPVAYCISNRADTILFQKFFGVIKERVGTITTEVFMSDGATAFYNGWRSVMGDARHYLLCWWHIFKNWNENMPKILCKEKKVEMKKTLRSFCMEVDEDRLQNSLAAFVRQLIEDEDTTKFGKYFQKEYMSKIKQWALCYRTHVGMNTNMVLEALHKKIKYNYLLGLKCKRLDKSLCALFRMINDEKFKRLIKIQRRKPSERIRTIYKTHEKSILQYKEASQIQPINNNSWCIKSASMPDRAYNVTKISESCKEIGLDCALKCKKCKICIHMYICTCMDSVMNGNLCKHIHAICCLNNEEGLNLENSDKSTINDITVEETEVVDTAPDTDINNIQERNMDFTLDIRLKSHEVLDIAQKKLFLGEHGLKVTRCIDTLIDLMNTSSPGERVTFHSKNKNQENVNPNQKIVKQKYFSTKRKRVKSMCHPGTLPNISETHARTILQSLNSQDPAVNILHTENFEHSYV